MYKLHLARGSLLAGTVHPSPPDGSVTVKNEWDHSRTFTLCVLKHFKNRRNKNHETGEEQRLKDSWDVCMPDQCRIFWAVAATTERARLVSAKGYALRKTCGGDCQGIASLGRPSPGALPAGAQPPPPHHHHHHLHHPRGGGGGAGAFLAKEEEYRRLNAELEAKTAELVRQAEEVMRDQQEALSRPISAQLQLFEEEAKSQRDLPSPDLPPLPLGLHKQQPQKKATSVPTARSGPQPGKARRGTLPSSVKPRPCNTPSSADVAVPDFSLAKTIGRIEGELEEGKALDLGDDLLPSAASELGAEAQIRFLKAKLRVMQEELDALAQECGKKDDENRSVSGRLRESEEERGRLQRAATLQQSQLEKYKALSEEAKRRSEGLQQKLSGLDKELENLKRAQKQASASQSTMEVRLNRALEESEKYKMELNRLKQSNKEAVNQEHKKLEELKVENKRLEKQKEELMAGFKKQLKLIDILKRQKMHIESAKMLSFTEEEFMKALDWGNS